MSYIIIIIVSLVAVMFFYFASRFRDIDAAKELSVVSKKSCLIANMNQERREFADLVTKMVAGSISAVEHLGGSDWEREFCQSVLRNIPNLSNARISNTQDTFVHAINLLRANYKSVEQDYYNRTYFNNYKVTQQLIYDCLDGDKEAIILMYRTVMNRCIIMKKEPPAFVMSKRDIRLLATG